MTEINLNRHFTAEIEDLLKILAKLPGAFDKEKKKEVLTKAAAPMVQAAREKAPIASEIVKRYSTPKVTGKLKAPKGAGVVATEYQPGNLKKSIRVLDHGKFKKTGNVFVGPKTSSGKAKSYGKSDTNVDGYYAAMVEHGTRYAKATPFMRPAFEETKEQVFQIAKEEFTKLIDEWEIKNVK